jgi:hypothetical protein
MASTSVSDFETAIDNCSSAIAAGNWATAWQYLAQSQVLYWKLPSQAGGGDKMVRWEKQLSGLREMLKEAQAQAGRSSAKRVGHVVTSRPGN